MAPIIHQYTSGYTYQLTYMSSDKATKPIPLMNETVQYIYISHDYSNAIMPIIYIKIRVTPKIYNLLVPDQGKGKLILEIHRIKDYIEPNKNDGTLKLMQPKPVIGPDCSEFDYFMTDNPDTFKKMESIHDNDTLAYRECLIGLIKLKFQTYNRNKYFEGIYKDVTSASLIKYALSGLSNVVIQPFNHNTTFNQFVCPTVTSRGQFISYVNSKSAFYRGSYMYYMDFNRTYLLANDGVYVDAKDGDPGKSISFHVLDTLDTFDQNSSKLGTGLVEYVTDNKESGYIVYMYGNSMAISIDRVTSSLVGNIEKITTDSGQIQSSQVNTSNITNIQNTEQKLMYISQDPNGADNLSKRITEATITIGITQNDLDTTIFTPNKQYNLAFYLVPKGDPKYEGDKYIGHYYMIKKDEYYIRREDKLRCVLNATFRKCIE